MLLIITLFNPSYGPLLQFISIISDKWKSFGDELSFCFTPFSTQAVSDNQLATLIAAHWLKLRFSDLYPWDPSSWGFRRESCGSSVQQLSCSLMFISWQRSDSLHKQNVHIACPCSTGTHIRTHALQVSILTSPCWVAILPAFRDMAHDCYNT